MDIIGSIAGGFFDALIAAFGWMSLGGSLAMLSILLGVVMLIAFKLIGNPDDMSTAMGRMQAHMMEMRLFDREPKLVFVAMGRLFWWNFKLVGTLMRPVLIATLPMLFLFIQMDHFYGMRPLQPGESAVVTARVPDPEVMRTAEIQLVGDDVVEVATPPVYSRQRGLVSWRVEALGEGDGLLELSVGEQRFGKSVTVSPTRQRVSKRRARRKAEALLYPIEPRLEKGPVRWIDIRYPMTDTDVLGVPMHWLIWLFIISLVGALGVRWGVNAWRPNTL